MTTRYYIERETAIPGEWGIAAEEPYPSYMAASTADKNMSLYNKNTGFRIGEIKESIVTTIINGQEE
jgi:hypothetical protein